jgi:hypothetical protein
MNSRIDAALNFALRYGNIDGAHHKTWVIDQMVRALTGCQMNAHGYQLESKEYLAWVNEACNGKDGPDTYDWNEGVAP